MSRREGEERGRGKREEGTIEVNEERLNWRVEGKLFREEEVQSKRDRRIEEKREGG